MWQVCKLGVWPFHIIIVTYMYFNFNNICETIKRNESCHQELTFEIHPINYYSVKFLLYLIIFSYTHLSISLEPQVRFLMRFLAQQSYLNAFTNKLQNWNLKVPDKRLILLYRITHFSHIWLNYMEISELIKH